MTERSIPGTKEAQTFTPGPWAVSLEQFGFTNSGERIVVYGDPATDNYGGIALVRPRQERQERGKNKTPYNAPDAERDANARLIAAAPDMLEALERAKAGLYNPFEPDNQCRAYHAVCDAIAKARGKVVQANSNQT